MPVTHEPWLVALSLIVAIQGAYVGLSLAVQVRGAMGAERRLLLAGAALSLGVAILVDALRRDAGSAASGPGRLPRLPDVPLLPRLRAGGRRGSVRGKRGPAHPDPARRVRRLHGRRYRHHALSRHDGAPRQPGHGPRPVRGCGERRRRDRRLGAGAPSRQRRQRPATTPPFGGGARHRYCRHALHRHGGGLDSCPTHTATARSPLRRSRPTSSPSSWQSSPSLSRAYSF